MRIMFNPDETVVKNVKRGLEKTGGYCPCRTERTEETRCMCTEFLNQVADPGFSGLCRCGLYCAVD